MSEGTVYKTCAENATKIENKPPPNWWTSGYAVQVYRDLFSFADPIALAICCLIDWPIL
jgi:hypothetical protein